MMGFRLSYFLSFFLFFFVVIFFLGILRGAASKAIDYTLKQYIKLYHSDIVIIQESRCSGNVARDIICKWSFHYFVIEKTRGFSGGHLDFLE